MQRSLALGCAVAVVAAGCRSEPAARQFAVTVTDAAEIDCYGYVTGLLVDPEDIEDAIDDAEDEWEEAHLADPPQPEGRVLWVNENPYDETMRAWFEPLPSAPGYEPLRDWAATASQPVVYLGGIHDDYIDGTYERVVNTDKADEEVGLNLCGNRVAARGQLTLTTVEGVVGRVRWTDVTHLASELSMCEGRIECVRNLEVEGLEVELD